MAIESLCRSSVMAAQFDVRYKVLILGDSGVGKTAIVRSLMGEKLVHSYIPTIGIDFVRKTFFIDGAKIELEIWDTAGQERFREFTKANYRGSQGLILVYDIANESSFNTLETWLRSIDEEINFSSKEPIPVIIVGNKIDLGDRRKIASTVLNKLIASSHVNAYMETSALVGVNISQTFEKLAKILTEVNNPKLLNAFLSPDEKELRLEAMFSDTRPKSFTYQHVREKNSKTVTKKHFTLSALSSPSADSQKSRKPKKKRKRPKLTHCVIS